MLYNTISVSFYLFPAPTQISLKRKAYEEAGIPADKAPHFAAQTVKANPAEQLSPLRHEDAEELKTEPKLTAITS